MLDILMEMGTTVVLEDVKASELPEAWPRRVKAKPNEVLTVTIAKRKTKTAAKTAKKPNAMHHFSWGPGS